uniref:RGS domain-containing protein n=1 Tax=Scophthalmus maximus TaxID=52904 RepID=A0A8D3CRC7_SCOMX
LTETSVEPLSDQYKTRRDLRRDQQRKEENNRNKQRPVKTSKDQPSPREVLKWAESLEALLTNQYGLVVFRHFLRSEFSEENLDFWLAVERFKRIRPLSKMAARATKIYEEFISTNAVNVDSSVREWTNHSLRLYAHPTSFNLAQDQIFGLMETESYPRFLRSRLFARGGRVWPNLRRN